MHATTMPHETKRAGFALTSVDAEGTFEGYASLFNVEDLSRDVIAPGAFRDSITKRGAGGIKLLYQHDPAEPIGVWLDIAEDARGLIVKGRLTLEVGRAREVLSLMKAGALEGLSIGFRTEKGSRDARSGIRTLKKIDLWEISVVTFPMQPGARVTAVKSGPFSDGKTLTEREFERFLTREAGLKRSEAAALMRTGFKSLAAMRDAGSGPSEVPDEAALMRRAARRLFELSQPFSQQMRTP
jgi:HK97 family phage prohead protease